MIKRNSPVLGQELSNIGNNAFLVPRGQLVQVVLVQTHEGPETLEHNLLTAYIGNRINQADGVECELYKVAFSPVQVVAHEVFSVLFLSKTFFKNQGICGLYVVEDQVSKEACALALRKVETGEVVLHARGVRWVRVAA